MDASTLLTILDKGGLLAGIALLTWLLLTGRLVRRADMLKADARTAAVKAEAEKQYERYEKRLREADSKANAAEERCDRECAALRAEYEKRIGDIISDRNEYKDFCMEALRTSTKLAEVTRQVVTV